MQPLVHKLLYICCWQTLKGLALKRHFLLLTAAVLVTLVTGCGEKNDESGSGNETAPLPTAATLGEQTALTAAEYLETEPYASANRSKGERQARLCIACHTLGKGGPNMIGPALYGFIGNDVGAREGFEYSAVMRNANFVWTPAALDAWLAQPGRFLPGNRMTFAGVPDRQDRVDLIAYLLAATSTDL